jgi:hypothetical protein
VLQLSSCEPVVFAFQQLSLLRKWIRMGLEDQVGEALAGGVRFLLEGLGSRVALGLVVSSGPGK